MLVSRRNVPPRNIGGMAEASDTGWRYLEGSWDRLRWSRLRKYETAKAAAESMGLRDNTYGGYERRPDSSRHVKLDHQNAIRFGRKFGVRWEWLLTGEGSPFDEMSPPVRRAIDIMSAADPDQQESIARAIEALAAVRKR